MAKILVALSAGLIVGVSSAAMAQQVSTPAAPSGASPATTIGPLTPTPNTSPLTPAPANGVLTNQSSSEVPSIVNPSPTETIRLDAAAASPQALQIDPNSSNVSILSADVVTTPQTATGVSLNTILAPATPSAPAPSANSPSFYPPVLGEPASTATFLSNFSGATSTTGLASLDALARSSSGGSSATPIARITSRSSAR
ncbi:hypothetical protein [Hyphomicrobium sp. 2TAF46]|uniref:hypothetical protein n=1 Tax=Hyphomicrobium sp. 2TAF46 TaxID=3233019 RepID=UPI003F93AC31